MNALFIILLFAAPLFAEGPNFQHKDTFVQQEFDNVYQDLRNARSANAVNFSTYSPTGVSSATTSSSSFVYSHILATITVRKSNNKVAMWATGTWANDTANDGCDIGFFRDSTFISATNGDQRIRNPAASVIQQSAFSIHKVDAPGTGTFVYRVGFRAAVGGTCTLNGVVTTDSPITLLEIVQ